MHKLHECVTKHIDEIVEKGISQRNLAVLGALVDIRKDVEEMWHWKSEDSGEHTESMESFLDMVQSMEPSKLYEYAEAIKRACESVQMPADMQAKFKTLFK